MIAVAPRDEAGPSVYTAFEEGGELYRLHCVPWGAGCSFVLERWATRDWVLVLDSHRPYPRRPMAFARLAERCLRQPNLTGLVRWLREESDRHQMEEIL